MSRLVLFLVLLRVVPALVPPRLRVLLGCPVRGQGDGPRPARGASARAASEAGTQAACPGVIINLTTGVMTSGSLGMLKNGPKLKWPSVLLDSRFDE